MHRGELQSPQREKSDNKPGKRSRSEFRNYASVFSRSRMVISPCLRGIEGPSRTFLILKTTKMIFPSTRSHLAHSNTKVFFSLSSIFRLLFFPTTFRSIFHFSLDLDRLSSALHGSRTKADLANERVLRGSFGNLPIDFAMNKAQVYGSLQGCPGMPTSTSRTPGLPGRIAESKNSSVS